MHRVRFIPDRSLGGSLILLGLNCQCSEKGCFFQGNKLYFSSSMEKDNIL